MIDMKLEITAETIMSTIAIVVALYTFYMESYHNKRSSKASLMSEYFNDIYKDRLISGIPLASSEIEYLNNGKINGVSKLCEEINNLLKKSSYFKYIDLSFYNELKNIIVELEDFLLLSEDKQINEDFDTGLSLRLKKLYSSINNKYIGY